MDKIQRILYQKIFKLNGGVLHDDARHDDGRGALHDVRDDVGHGVPRDALYGNAHHGALHGVLHGGGARHGVCRAHDDGDPFDLLIFILFN